MPPQSRAAEVVSPLFDSFIRTYSIRTNAYIDIMAEQFFDSALVDAVNAVLTRPDWALHLPEFATVPFFGTDSEYDAAEGKTEHGWPAFKIEPISELTKAALDDDEDSAPRTEGDHFACRAKDRAFLREYSHLPEDLRALYRAAGRSSDSSDDEEAEQASTTVLEEVISQPNASAEEMQRPRDFSDTARLTTVDIKNKAIVYIVEECVLAPLLYALTHLRSGQVKEEQGLYDDLQGLLDGDGTYRERATLSILVHLTLQAGSLRWRPDYFRFSIHTLVLQGCQLQSDCLHPLGSFAMTDPNLVVLDLSMNECFVSRADSDDTCATDCSRLSRHSRQGNENDTEAFARYINQSNVQVLDLSFNPIYDSIESLAALLLNLSSSKLQDLRLLNFFTEEGYAMVLESRERDRQLEARWRSNPDTGLPQSDDDDEDEGADEDEEEIPDATTAEMAMRCSILIAAFLRACAEARACSALIRQPPFESQLIERASPITMEPFGCRALLQLDLSHAALGRGGIDLIEGVWHVATRSVHDHPNALVARVLPQVFPVDFTGCETFQSSEPTAEHLSNVFALAAELGGETLDEGDEITFDPFLDSLSRTVPEEADFEAFAAFLSDSPRQSFDGLDHSFDAEFEMMAPSAQAFRSATLSLLAAARVLACRVRTATLGPESSNDSPRTHWLFLPVEVRRACLEAIPTLSVPTADDLRCMLADEPATDTYIEKIRGHSVLSTKVIDRVLAYAADRRTIGYGRVPEASFRHLRLASDESVLEGEPTMRVLDEPKWSFLAAHRRWQPLDCRSQYDAKYLLKGAVKLSWEAECFIRSVGLAEDLIELLPRGDARLKQDANM